jgi:hypothetical protein
MPLNKKGKKIKKAMVKQYGKKKGESVFYAMENSGKLRKVIKAVSGRDAGMGMAGKTGDFGGSKGGGNGRDPSAQYKDSKPLSQKSKEALTAQRERARGRISPSTTPVGRAVTQGIGVLTGVPYFGGKLGAKMVDYSPMAFGVPKSTRPKQTMMADTKGDSTPLTQPIIPGPIAIDQPIMPLSQRRLATVSPTGRFGYTAGLKKGGMLRQGKPKIAKKGWK